jgi:hypothetical protein
MGAILLPVFFVPPAQIPGDNNIVWLKSAGGSQMLVTAGKNPLE